MRTTDAATFGYMQARIQARHGDRPDPSTWRQLDTCRDLARFLQLARESSLRPWVRHFAPHDDPELWERSLRNDWSRNLLQLAEWVPDRWRAGIAWLRTLPMLPALTHLLGAEPATAWMHEDEFFADLDLTGTDAFHASLGQSDWQALLDHWDPDHPAGSWFAAWRTQWPERAPVAELEHACRDLASTWSAALERQRWQAALDARCTRLLRRHARTILALIGHVGLVSLDVTRLRAGLIRLHISAQIAGSEP